LRFVAPNLIREPSPSVVFTDDGTRTATLTVTADDGSTSTVTHAVTTNNVAPTVLTASDLVGDEGQSLGFVGTFRDPGVLDTHTTIGHWRDGTVDTTEAGTVTLTYSSGGPGGSHDRNRLPHSCLRRQRSANGHQKRRFSAKELDRTSPPNDKVRYSSCEGSVFFNRGN
jgi:hypothetical protein